MRPSTVAVLALAAGALVPACGLNQEGVPPFHDAIAFPASALMDPGGRWLYVANSNSDLRYNDGTLVALDIDKVNARVTALATDPTFGPCPQVGYIHPHSDPNTKFCCQNQLDRSITDCDERQFIQSDATVRIGSFAAGMVMQPVVCPDPSKPDPCTTQCGADPPASRLFFGVRGNSSITYVDIRHEPDVSFTCDSTGQPFAECDTAHQIDTTKTTIGSAADVVDPTPLVLPDEPYALTIDEQQQFLYVGHLKGDTSHAGSGGMSLIDVRDPIGRTPQFVAVLAPLFPPDGNGLFGVTALTDHNGEIFASSRNVPRVAAVVPTVDNSCNADQQIALVGTGDGFDTTLVGSEVRGVQFVDDAERLFALQRVPPALIGFDRGIDPSGVPGIVPSDVMETCSSPTFLQSHNAAGLGQRLYITCFDQGEVYVVDPYLPRVTNVIEVGRGPAGLVFGPGPGDAPDVDADQTTRAYVVGFSDNDIAVLDLLPGSPTEFHITMHIGFPSTVPR
jgi:DNA-binding beta-propeller fold protein YncE